MKIIVCLLILFLICTEASLAEPLVGNLEVPEGEILYLSPGTELSFVESLDFEKNSDATLTIYGGVVGEGNADSPVVIIPENLYVIGNPNPEKKLIIPYRMDLRNVEDELSFYRRLYLLGQISHGLFIGYKYHRWFK